MKRDEAYVKGLEDKVEILVKLVGEHAKSTQVLDWLRSQLKSGASIKATNRKEPILDMKEKAVFGNLSLDFSK